MKVEPLFLAVAPPWGVASVDGEGGIGHSRTEDSGRLAAVAEPQFRGPTETYTMHLSPFKTTGSCVYAEMRMCPARGLFNNPEVHVAVTNGLMRAGRRVFVAEDRPMVWAAVVDGFRNISSRLQERAPHVASILDKVQLSEVEKDAVLSSMKLPSEPQVQRIGLDVARAIRDSGCTLEACVQRRIEERLRLHRGKLWELRELLVPTPLRELWGQEHQWAMTLDPENIRAIESVVGKFFAEDELEGKGSGGLGGEAATLSPAEKSLVVLGGVLAEGRALLDSLRLSVRHFGKELDVPLWATSLGGVWRDFGAPLASCSAEPEEVGRIRFLKELFCPLMLGSQGLEALRAAPGLATGAVPAPAPLTAGLAGEEPLWAPV